MLSLDRRSSPVAFDVHLEDGRVVNKAVDGGHRHSGVWKNFSPFAKRLVGRDQQRSPLVSRADEFKQNAGFRLILADVGQIVQ